MSHFVGLIFGPEETISERLSTYDESLKVEPYIDRTPKELREWAEERVASFRKYIEENIESTDEYKRENAQTFKDKLDNYNNFETDEDYQRYIEASFDLDEKGNSISTYNPLSKWDWYVQGGRWSGEILHAGSYNTDQARIEDLTKIDTPYCFIDPDGGWHERGSMGWWGISYDEKDDGTWETEFREYLKTLPEDTLVTVIDFHI